MAKRVAPGHLKIKDESLGVHPKKAIYNGKSKNSKTDGKKGGSRIAGRKSKALNDTTTEKKSPQPEASSKEDINIGDFFSGHDHSKCIEEEKAEMLWMLRMNSPLAIFSRLDCKSIQEEEIELPNYMNEVTEWSLLGEESELYEWSSPPRTPLS